MKKLVIGIVAISLIGTLPACKKKEGCTDSTATNYDADATKDDGSCTYATTTPTTTATTETIKDDGTGTGTTTWTKDKVYYLDGFVFVNAGQTLTIEAGTVIKGLPGTGASASALIVAKGGKIMAQGTASEPIIFTFEADPLDGSVPITTQGQWGGLIILGSAKLNSTPGTTQIEGIPTTEARGIYGGLDDTDNSGVLQYVSIRHGGTDIGAGNEINGLTLGGVGSGTVIDHIEVIANADDGVEFFGGTAQVKYCVTAYCGDDSYDYDEGFRGKGQFWLTIQGASSDRGGEHDGGTTPEDGAPYAHPVIYNATYIGNDSASSRALTFRDNAGGEYHNSVFHGFGKGIDIEDLSSGEDSKARLDAGDLKLANIILSSIAATNKIVDNSGGDLSAHANVSGVSTTTAGISKTNPVPSTALGTGTAPSDSWFDNVTYIGAFGSTNWAQGWTLLFP